MNRKFIHKCGVLLTECGMRNAECGIQVIFDTLVSKIPFNYISMSELIVL